MMFRDEDWLYGACTQSLGSVVILAFGWFGKASGEPNRRGRCYMPR